MCAEIDVLIRLDQSSNQPDESLLFWSLAAVEEGTDLKMLDLTTGLSVDPGKNWVNRARSKRVSLLDLTGKANPGPNSVAKPCLAG